MVLFGVVHFRRASKRGRRFSCLLSSGPASFFEVFVFRRLFLSLHKRKSIDDDDDDDDVQIISTGSQDDPASAGSGQKRARAGDDGREEDAPKRQK